MLLKYKEDHISIKSFNSVKIEDLTILTGLNGSEKTHFLDALQKGLVELDGFDKSEMIYYNYSDFTILSHGHQNDQLYRKKMMNGIVVEDHPT